MLHIVIPAPRSRAELEPFQSSVCFALMSFMTPKYLSRFDVNSKPNPLFRDRLNSQLLILLISQIWGPSPLPTFQLTCWNQPNGHMSFSDTADSWSKCPTLHRWVYCLCCQVSGGYHNLRCVHHMAVFIAWIQHQWGNNLLWAKYVAVCFHSAWPQHSVDTHTHTDRSLSYYRFNCSNDSDRIGLLRLCRHFWPATLRVGSGMEEGKDEKGLLDIPDKHIQMRIYVGLRSVKD